MNNKQIATRFAKGATSGKGSNLFIEEDSIYSYGRHFKVAERHASGKVWLNPEKYSQSTTRHQSLVRQALHREGIETL